MPKYIIHLEEVRYKKIVINCDENDEPADIALNLYEQGYIGFDDATPTCLNTMVEDEDGMETGWDDHPII